MNLKIGDNQKWLKKIIRSTLNITKQFTEKSLPKQHQNKSK